MEKSLVSICSNELFITHAEFQGCFIKIWASFYSQKKLNMEKSLQDYQNYTKELNKLDLIKNNNTVYVYVWNSESEVRVYRCKLLSSNLADKTHTIMLIDYGRTMIVSFSNVREVTKDIDLSLLVGLSQRATVYTFLLSGFISKPRPNTVLILNNILCNKYYKYRKDFEIGGVSFITLNDVGKRLIISGVADAIEMSTMINIANNMSSIIASNNSIDIVNTTPNLGKNSSKYLLEPQKLDCVTYMHVIVMNVSMDEDSILLSVRTIDNDSETINNYLTSINRQSLKLAPFLEVFTPCLILLRNKLARAVILEVKISSLYVDLVDYGVREYIPRSNIFEIPANCNSIEMRSLNVILDKPKNINSDNIQSILVKKQFQMLPLKIDPIFGLYKVKLFIEKNKEFIDLWDVLNDLDMGTTAKLCPSTLRKSPEFSITEINEEVKCIENPMIPKENKADNYPRSIHIESNQNEEKNSVTQEIYKEISYDVSPIKFLRKEEMNKDNEEMIGQLIYYKSPFNFRLRQYDPSFNPYMDRVKSLLNTRYVLKKQNVVKNMYVIYQNQTKSIYRAQVIDMDSEIERIKLQLIDEGSEVIHENFESITLYNFIESDCNLPGQLVLNCSLSNMWFPIINVDTALILQPYFNKELLYKVRIIETNESGINMVQMFQKDTNLDISKSILKSGIGQRLCAALKTEENPYEESLLKGQSILSYVYHNHFKLCIQPEPNTVDELEEEIREYIKTNPEFEEMDINHLQGTYCLATVDNEQWFRAYVKNVFEECIIVNLFDISLLADLSINQIRSIPNYLMKRAQLCLNCSVETKDFNIKITEKTLYNVTVESINANGTLSVTIKEHNTAPLSSPVIRSIEQISFVHVEGDLTYLQRSQDKAKLDRLSEALSRLNGKLDGTPSVVPGEVYLFENHGKYYRCVVKSTNSKLAVVHCIDFGFEKQIERKKLQPLGDCKLARLPALVITVKTFPTAFNVPKTTFLAYLWADVDGTFGVTPYKTSIVHPHCELFDELQDGNSGCLANVTNVVNSDGECWIVPHLFFGRLKTISDTLVGMQSKMVPSVTEPGSLCAALHPVTKKWHRAILSDDLGGDSLTLNVLAIDSGEQFEALKTTRLPGELQKIPNCSLRCRATSGKGTTQLLNKDVMCRLTSLSGPLLEVELWSNKPTAEDNRTATVPSNDNQIVPAPLKDNQTIDASLKNNQSVTAPFKDNQSIPPPLKNNRTVTVPSVDVSTMDAVTDIKWTVSVERFESFEEFYVAKIIDQQLVAEGLKELEGRPPIGTQVMTTIDHGDNVWYKAEVMAYNEESAIVRLENDGCVCKSIRMRSLSADDLPTAADAKMFYRCRMEDVDDVNANDPANADLILDMMKSCTWIMKTHDSVEPYTVTLTSCIDGEDFFNKLYTIFAGSCNVSSPTVVDRDKQDAVEAGTTVNGHCKDHIVNGYYENAAAMSDNVWRHHNGGKNEFMSPNEETVTVKSVESFQLFYVESESIKTLYEQRISEEVDMCVVMLKADDDLVGSVVVTCSRQSGYYCRAKVESVNGGSGVACCYLMDLGTYEDCTEFYKPTEFLRDCPAVVRRCELHVPKLVGKEHEVWFPSVNDMFRDIVAIPGVTFNMTVVCDRDPCSVTLRQGDSDVGEMLVPLNVLVTRVRSLTDFNVRVLCEHQRSVELAFSGPPPPLVPVYTPLVGGCYAAKVGGRTKRVRYERMDGGMYVVEEMDDTMDMVSVDALYELPAGLRDLPIFTMSCSLIIGGQDDGIWSDRGDPRDEYSLDAFRALSDKQAEFVMCLINESENNRRSPHLVRLYLAGKDVLDVIRFTR